MRYRVFFLLFFCVGLAVAQQRVPANPSPAVVHQPNKDSLSIRLIGDEWHHYNTTLDGYLIVQNQRGYWCYGSIKNPQKPSLRKAHNKGQRTCCEQRWLEKNGVTNLQKQ